MTENNQPHQDAVLRKIGRNVVNFQKLELALKTLILVTSAYGTFNDFQTRQIAKKKKTKKLSLGNLANTFHKNIYEESEKNEPTDFSQGWFSVSFKVDIDPAVAKEKKRALIALVKERNRLIHSDIVSLDLNSAENCANFSAKLDSQNEHIYQQLAEMERIRDAHKKISAMQLAFINSDEFLEILSKEIDDA